MTRQKALVPSAFVGAVEDYAHGEIDETYVRKWYEAQISGVRHHTRDPLPAEEFVAAIIANAGVDVTDPDRDRIREVYAEQIDTAEELAGDPRV
ncbi:hypothetical protein [Halostella litorea]|uniref:hypothetical protein n=1 Tax=Halostella litorea TaxID=2528831 RepID=UPI0010928E76|nr:hypothetical protein [Halostella litorea]